MYYTITFYDDDGVTVLATQQVEQGAMPDYTPVKDGLYLNGWNPALTPATDNASYVAIWDVGIVVLPETQVVLTEQDQILGGTNRGTQVQGETEFSADTKEIVAGNTYLVTIDGIEYELTAVKYYLTYEIWSGNTVYLGNPWARATCPSGALKELRVGTKTGTIKYESDFSEDFCISSTSNSANPRKDKWRFYATSERTITVKAVQKL